MRTKIEIGDLSSCSWYCDEKLRLKGVTAVIDSTGADVPDPYTAPVGEIPENLAEGALVLEVWDNGLALWTQTSCDSDEYEWTLVSVIATGSASGNLTTFQLKAGNSGAAPASPVTPPAAPANGDALIQRHDDYTLYWLRTGGSWVLTFSDSNSENFNTYYENNEAHDVPSTSADPPNPAGTNPSTNLELGDTYTTKYATHTVFYTYSGAAWVEDFRIINATIASLSIGTGLTNTAGVISANISTGVSGGQTIYGGTASGNNLTIFSTSNATKGKIIFGTSAYDEVNNRLGIGTTTPTNKLTVVGGDALINTLVVGLGTGSVATNTALGVTALNANTSGASGVAVGYQALLVNTSGTLNTAVGAEALKANTIGGSNTALGYLSNTANTSGSLNVTIGAYSLRKNTTGSNNVVIGYAAGDGTSGAYDNNILLGYNAGSNITTGATANIVIGYNLNLQTAGGSNQLTIGNLIFGTGLTSTGSTVSTGNIGIGLAAPTARLHLPAGTATAGTAPLKLTTGTALTTPADGALEYHTSHLYFTIGSTRYQLDQQLASANNGVSFSGGVLQLGTASAGTGSADFTATRYIYQAAQDLSIGGSFATHSSFPIMYISGSTGRIGLHTASPAATLEITNTAGLGAAPSLATINAAGVAVTTGTAATVGAQQVSNPVRWRGYGWETTGSTSQAIDFVSYVLPIQGTTASGDWILQSSINGAAYTNKLYYSTGGNLSLGTNATTTYKLEVKGSAATITSFLTSAGVEVFKLSDTSNTLGGAAIPLTTFATKTVANYAFTALANSEIGYNIVGTSTARATASDDISGVTLSTTLVSAAATQTLAAFRVNATFTDAFSATKYLIDLQTAGASKLTQTSEGKLFQTATFTSLATNAAGVQMSGTVTARNSAAEIISGLYVTTGLTANGSAASQILYGANLTQTLISDVTSHTLVGLHVNTTFTYTQNPTRRIFDFKNAGTTRLHLSDVGVLTHTPVFTTTASNDTGSLFTGTITARNTASDIANGIYVTLGVTAAAAATQTLNGVNIAPTLTSNVATHILNGLVVNPTFTVTNAPTQNIVNFKSGGTSRLILTADGRLYGTALHNNANPVTGTTTQYIASGTYTPTITNGANVAASDPNAAVWVRVGNVVTVSGSVDIDPTATGNTIFDISLPITTSSIVAGGGVASESAFGGSGAIEMLGNTAAQVNMEMNTTSNWNVSYVFSYEIV